MSALVDKVEVLLSLVNKVTGPARQITESLSKVTAAANRATLAMRALGRMKGVQNIGKGVGGILGQVSAVTAPALALTGTAGLAGIIGAAHATSDLADRMATLAGIGGVDVEQFQLLAYAAEQANVPLEGLSKGFQFLNKNIAQARSGNKQALQMFSALGVSVADLQSLTPDQVMMKLADAFDKIENPSLKAAASMAVFGKSGASLIPFLEGGSKALGETTAKAKRLGLALTGSENAAVKDYADNVGTLMMALRGLRDAISVQVIPLLEPLVNRLTEWVAANRKLIASRVADFVKRLAVWLEKVNFDAVLDGIRDFLSGVSRAVDIVGGWGNALTVLGLSMTGLLGPLLQITLGLTQFGFALIAATGPVGIILAAIAGLAAGVYLIIDNWSSIGPFFENLWGGILDFLGGIIGPMARLGGRIIGALWDGMKSMVTGLFGWIFDTVQSLVELITWPIRAISDMAVNVITGGGVNPIASVSNTAPKVFGGNGFAGSQGLLPPASLDGPTGLLPPPAAAARPQQIGGEVVMRFENAPEGLRVKATSDTPGLKFRPDLGPAFGIA